ncbi:cytochrome b5 reductase 4 [Colletotrichum spaethianum]|uniref:Cytochrome b5 reductase 4 n=1 Tax=Colletotrichum spaethianum TaxID=700344 RepID=A0AA37L8R5_9PEZI|nr:cytochrome b5 reductase 4 [Colletotrichum spaethianum]GKT41500.1 cytochrome b5 reductase 4 [Colletotrichum spaethianum]
MMPPPSAPRGPVPPRLAAFPAANSPQRARGPVPNRGPSANSSLGSSLAPPPTHSAKAPKPSRKVILTPGHSPLDWARISGPNADLRNLPAETPYLKVTPSMLKTMTGRKGKDAWMALGGRVYNITPYLPYHPAGVPELLRALDGTGPKIHPWVNYETMLSACLVGLLVEEDEGSKPSAMDEMD